MKPKRSDTNDPERLFDAWEVLADAAHAYSSDSSVENAKDLRAEALAYVAAVAKTSR